jgi:hypothetical protein
MIKSYPHTLNIWISPSENPGVRCSTQLAQWHIVRRRVLGSETRDFHLKDVLLLSLLPLSTSAISSHMWRLEDGE